MNCEHCQKCGKPYQVLYWVIPNKLWTRITGKKGNGLYCPRCLHKMAKEKGIELYWEAREAHSHSCDNWKEE